MNTLDQIADLWASLPQMPHHTSSHAIIPHPYGNFPRDAMEYSARIDNKFLNDNLAIVEEIAYRDKSNPIPKWFRDYQIRYFASHGILAHDCFFTSRLRDGWRKGFSPDFREIREIGRAGSTRGYFVNFGKVNGADIVMGDTSSHANVGITNIFYCSPTSGSTGVVGEYYNQIALNCFNSTGNMKLACYDEGSTNPNNKIGGETSSVALDSAFTWRAVSEFALTTTKIWLAFQCDNASNSLYYTYPGPGLRRSESHTYANAFPSPATPSAMDSLVINMKIGHS